MIVTLSTLWPGRNRKVQSNWRTTQLRIGDFVFVGTQALGLESCRQALHCTAGVYRPEEFRNKCLDPSFKTNGPPNQTCSATHSTRQRFTIRTVVYQLPECPFPPVELCWCAKLDQCATIQYENLVKSSDSR